MDDNAKPIRTKASKINTIIVISIVLIIISVIVFFLIGKQYLSDKDIRNAEVILRSFVSITDPENDFVNMMGEKEPGGGKPNNLNPYKLPYCDIKSLEISSDGTYVYFKETFWGNFPKKATVINGDVINDIGTKVNIVDKNAKDIAIHGATINYYLSVLTIPATDSMYESTGIEFPEEKRFAKHLSLGQVYFRPNNDYLILRIPIQYIYATDDKFLLTFSVEGESKKYGHSCVDFLGGVGNTKQQAIYEVNLKTKEYKSVSVTQ